MKQQNLQKIKDYIQQTLLRNPLVANIEQRYFDNLATHEQRILLAFAVALIVHLIIISIQFVSPPTPKYSDESLDIILNPIQVNEDEPIEADYLAQSSQQGGGQLTQDLKTANVLANQSSQAYSKQKNQKSQQQRKQKQLLTQRQSAMKVASLDDQRSERQKIVEETTQQSEVTPLKQQIIDLEAELDVEAKIFAKNSKRKFVNASTSKSHDAEYIKHWTKRIEKVGNQHYPKQLHQLGVSGKLVLAVVIDAKGKVLDINIRQSSKNPILDKAAIDIVKKAAPFPAIPKRVLLDNNSLVITRTWLFSHGTGLISR